MPDDDVDVFEAASASAAPPRASAPIAAMAAPSQQQPPQGAPKAGPNGRHAVAALKKVSGTLERTETDVDHGSPYEAHIRKSDGSEVEVLVNENFEGDGRERDGRPPVVRNAKEPASRRAPFAASHRLDVYWIPNFVQAAL